VANGREQYLQALASLSELTRTRAERVAGLLAKQGEVQSAQVNRVAEDLMRRTQKNREVLSRLVQREVKRQLGLFGMATRDEVARLQQRVRALEQAAERSGKATTASAAKPAAAKPSTRTRAGGTSSRSRATSSGASGRAKGAAGSAATGGTATRRSKSSAATGTGGTATRRSKGSAATGATATRRAKGSAGSTSAGDDS
jgi:polyhydroxyalkanoate synthesis regulator phasin